MAFSDQLLGDQPENAKAQKLEVYEHDVVQAEEQVRCKIREDSVQNHHRRSLMQVVRRYRKEAGIEKLLRSRPMNLIIRPFIVGNGRLQVIKSVNKITLKERKIYPSCQDRREH